MQVALLNQSIFGKTALVVFFHSNLYIELTMLCDRIQSRYTNNTPVLVYNYWASSPFTGFGSMLHAVVALIASAAAGNYHLYCNVFLYFHEI